MSNNKQNIEKHSKKVKKVVNKKKRIILILIEIILLIVVIFSGRQIFNWVIENNQNNSIKEELSNAVTENKEQVSETKWLDAKNYNIDFDSLKSTNSEVVGWLKVNNLDIEYPVVQAKDNEYYLTRNIKKEYNSAGWIFADYRNKLDGTDKNIVLYGHNRKDGSMFGSLKDSQQAGWYENDENKYLVYITENEKSNYEIFSVYNVETEDYYIKTGFAKGEFEKFINRLKARSVHDFGVEVTEDDSILTLSTCAGENQRTVLHAKKVIE